MASSIIPKALNGDISLLNDALSNISTRFAALLRNTPQYVNTGGAYNAIQISLESNTRGAAFIIGTNGVGAARMYLVTWDGSLASSQVVTFSNAGAAPTVNLNSTTHTVTIVIGGATAVMVYPAVQNGSVSISVANV